MPALWKQSGVTAAGMFLVLFKPTQQKAMSQPEKNCTKKAVCRRLATRKSPSTWWVSPWLIWLRVQ